MKADVRNRTRGRRGWRRLANGRGSNSAQLRRYNERLVLQRLRRAGEASKADLARAGRSHQHRHRRHHREARRSRPDRGRRQAPWRRPRPAGDDAAAQSGRRLWHRRQARPALDRDHPDRFRRPHPRQRRDHDRVLPAPEEALALVRRDVLDLLATPNPAARARFAGVGVAQPYNLGAWLGRLGRAGRDLRPLGRLRFSGAARGGMRPPGLRRERRQRRCHRRTLLWHRPRRRRFPLSVHRPGDRRRHRRRRRLHPRQPRQCRRRRRTAGAAEPASLRRRRRSTDANS